VKKANGQGVARAAVGQLSGESRAAEPDPDPDGNAFGFDGFESM
jgi:hypothetical protein